MIQIFYSPCNCQTVWMSVFYYKRKNTENEEIFAILRQFTVSVHET